MTSNCNFRKSENTQDKFKMLEVDYRSTPFNGELKPGKCAQPTKTDEIGNGSLNSGAVIIWFDCTSLRRAAPCSMTEM